MYCPNCGKENGSALRFCTGCGFRLDSVQLVIDAQSNGVFSQAGAPGRRSRFNFQNPTLIGVFLSVLGIFVAIIGAANHDGDIRDLGTFVTIVGVLLVALQGVFFSIREMRSGKQKPALPLPPELPRQISSPETRYNIGSVTEQATRDLDSTR